MKRIKRLVFLTVGLILLINLVTPQFDFLLERSIENQINFLEKKFSKKLSNQLQEKYPEGELFSNLIFALSIIEFSNYKDGLNSDLVDNSILASISKQSKFNYEKELLLPYGAFYNGWINYTLKKYSESELIKNSPNKEKILNLHRKISDRIIESHRDSVQLLETYTNLIWAADNILCIASLNKEHQNLKNKWLLKIRESSKDKLINHYGRDSIEIRGSSQALINYFLPEIDSSYSVESYEEYKIRFENRFLGISFIKEYESSDKSGDIDSGPIVFGYGSVATIMNSKLRSKIRGRGYSTTFGFLNALGFPINLFGEKYYLFGIEPMFDLFMLWNSVGLLDKFKSSKD